MNITIHITTGDDPMVEALKLLKQVHTGIGKILTNQEHTMADLTRLTSEVTETRTVVDSAVVLLNNLAALVRQNANDPVALNALADQLDAQQSDLAAAVTANTPAEDEPPSA